MDDKETDEIEGEAFLGGLVCGIGLSIGTAALILLVRYLYRCIAIGVICLLTVMPAHARPKIAIASHIVLWGTISVDLGTTWRGMNRGAQEALLTQHRPVQAVVVIGSGFLLEWALRKAPAKVAIPARLAVGTAHLLAGLHNIRVTPNSVYVAKAPVFLPAVLEQSSPTLPVFPPH